MTHILDLNAQMGLRGLKWFAAQSGEYFDFEHIIEKRLEDGRHDWTGQYPGVRVTVANAPEILTVSWSYILEDGSEGIVETHRADISPEDYKTLTEYRRRIIDNIKDFAHSLNIPIEIMR